jgi:predicted TIM-barrel fold metal-dependent hydrolase
MRITDAQMHEPAPWADWTGESKALQHRLLIETVAAYLDALGIDRTVIFPADESFAPVAAAAMPHRFTYVPHVAPEEEDLDRFVGAAKDRRAQGQVGLRAVLGWPLDRREIKRLDAGVWDPVFAACEHHRVPLFCMITGDTPKAGGIAERYPGLTLIVDHLGLRQPPMDEREPEPFARLPELLALARYPNIAVKLCGLPSLSKQSYPYPDSAQALRQIVDAFGAGRLMWASDSSRFNGRFGIGRMEIPNALVPYPGKHSHAEALMFIRESPVLSDEEKRLILGGAAEKILGWP